MNERPLMNVSTYLSDLVAITRNRFMLVNQAGEFFSTVGVKEFDHSKGYP